MSRTAPSRSALRRGVLIAVILVCSPAWLRSEEADAGPGKELCRSLWEGYLEAIKAQQPERIPFAKDAVVIYPDMLALSGRDAIEAHLGKLLSGLKTIEVGFKIDRCEVVGPRAYAFVTVDELIQEGATAPARRHARCAAVWEQQPDKSWRIAHFLVNYRKL